MKAERPPRMAYRVNEVADMLGVNRETVRRWCGNGTLDAAKVGEVWLISPAAVSKLLESHRRSRRPADGLPPQVDW